MNIEVDHMRPISGSVAKSVISTPLKESTVIQVEADVNNERLEALQQQIEEQRSYEWFQLRDPFPVRSNMLLIIIGIISLLSSLFITVGYFVAIFVTVASVCRIFFTLLSLLVTTLVIGVHLKINWITRICYYEGRFMMNKTSVSFVLIVLSQMYFWQFTTMISQAGTVCNIIGLVLSLFIVALWVVLWLVLLCKYA